MRDFAGMEDLLQDFLVEAGDLLSGVDNKLVDLERSPDDRGLLNDIFRGFHTIKGGAGFLNATELVTLCHLTESLFDKLRNGELRVTPERMDVILAATGAVRDMFNELEPGSQAAAADAALLDSLRAAVSGNSTPSAAAITAATPPASAATTVSVPRPGEPDWDALYAAVTAGTVVGEASPRSAPAVAPRVAGAPRRAQPAAPRRPRRPRGRCWPPPQRGDLARPSSCPTQPSS